jgi:hypothetical protein
MLFIRIGCQKRQTEVPDGVQDLAPVWSLLPIQSICDGNASKDQRHLSEEYDQTEDRQFGTVEHDDPDQNGDGRVSARKLDRQGLELAAVGSQRGSYDQTGTRGDDREYDRRQNRHTEVFEDGSSEA